MKTFLHLITFSQARSKAIVHSVNGIFTFSNFLYCLHNFVYLLFNHFTDITTNLTKTL